jgi:PAS domain S-box-containing protein
VDYDDINYEKTFDSSPAMIIVVGADGRVVKANKAACDDAGKPRDQVEGRLVHELFPFDVHTFLAGYQQVIETREPVMGVVEQCHYKTGEERWSLCNKIPCFGKGGEVVGVCIMAVNVTSQKLLERDLAKANRILSVQSGLAEKILLEDSDMDVDLILADVGRELDLDSVFIYRCNSNAHLINSWVSNPRTSLPQSMPLNGSEKSIRRWIEGSWRSADCMPTELDFAFKRAVGAGMETIAFVPIMGPEGAWGIVGFGTSACRSWCEKEMDALSGLGRLIAMLGRTVRDNRDFHRTLSAEIREISSLFSSTSAAREYAQ